MSFLFDTDLDALNAHYNRQGEPGKVDAAAERIKAGIRINTGTSTPECSDPEALYAQINAMNQSIAATQTMVDQFKEAEAELGRINFLIDTIRRKAREVVEDADCDTATARCDQAEIRSALRAIDRIAEGLCSYRKVWWAGSDVVDSHTSQNAMGPDFCSENSVSLSLPDLSTHSLGMTSAPGHTLANIDVMSAAGANRALRILNAASATVDSCWEQLCAFRREVLQPACNSMSVKVSNLAASLARTEQAEAAQESLQAVITPKATETKSADVYSAHKLPAPFLQML